jgi:hypothetical protein
LTIDHWNRVVVELQLSNPNSFGGAFYSGRIFVNHTSIPSRTYFGSSAAPLLDDHTELTVDICSTMISGSSTRNSSVDGNYDMMNFMWYKGDGSLYQNSSGDVYLIQKYLKFGVDQTCFLSGFLDPNQSACLICNPGYYLNGRICVSSCSPNEFLDSDTSSCQSKISNILFLMDFLKFLGCFYPSRYYVIFIEIIYPLTYFDKTRRMMDIVCLALWLVS